jgi:tRNA pseudouridine38-40 synthase
MTFAGVGAGCWKWKRLPPISCAQVGAGKTYRYRIYREAICPPFLARYVWHYPFPLDERGDGAGGAAGGRRTRFHFVCRGRSGARARKANASIECAAIFSSSWERQGDELVYTVKGSGFLHHMVRNLVGTFILVGKGTLQVKDVTRILQARNRSAAGATAPASGLVSGECGVLNQRLQR